MSDILLKKTDFRTSIAEISTYRLVAESNDLPEICVVGRSNVGKSSVINLIAGRKNLAKTSSTPGRTRLLNMFDFVLGHAGNTQTLNFTLIDLPGYGYAKAAKTQIERWGALTDEYFGATNKLKHVLALIDIRHPPSALDKQMINFLTHRGIGFTLISTKADKISASQMAKHIQMLATNLAVGKGNIIPTSTLKPRCRQDVLDRLWQVLVH